MNTCRPCVYVGCRYSNYGYRTPRGAYKLSFPNREPWEMPADKSCALDVADAHDRRKPKTMRAIAKIMNHVQQRVFQLELSAFQKLMRSPVGRELAQVLGKRRRRADI